MNRIKNSSIDFKDVYRAFLTEGLRMRTDGNKIFYSNLHYTNEEYWRPEFAADDSYSWWIEHLVNK